MGEGSGQQAPTEVNLYLKVYVADGDAYLPGDRNACLVHSRGGDILVVADVGLTCYLGLVCM